MTTKIEETAALKGVVAERERQIESEGWTPEHDDYHHHHGQLAAAAACYALSTVAACYVSPDDIHRLWPWSYAWWKPKDRRRNLVKAGALILAEIERLDRAEAK